MSTLISPSRSSRVIASEPKRRSFTQEEGGDAYSSTYHHTTNMQNGEDRNDDTDDSDDGNEDFIDEPISDMSHATQLIEHKSTPSSSSSPPLSASLTQSLLSSPNTDMPAEFNTSTLLNTSALVNGNEIEEEYSEDDINEVKDEGISETGGSTEYHAGGNGRRKHVNMGVWDQLNKLIKDDKVQSVQNLFSTELKKDTEVHESEYINRQDATGSTFLHWMKSPSMAQFLCKFPNINFEISNQQGATPLWHHLESGTKAKGGTAFKMIARILVEHGANIFFRNVVKHKSVLELIDSNDFRMQLRRSANLCANRRADPLLTGEKRAYYESLFQALDTNGDGIIDTDDIYRLWYSKRNEELFRQAIANPELIKQMNEPPKAKAKKPSPASEDKKDKKKSAPAKSSASSDSSTSSLSIDQPVLLTEEDRLVHFVADRWDMDGDGKFCFLDFVRMIIEFDHTSDLEWKFQAGMLETPRKPGVSLSSIVSSSPASKPRTRIGTGEGVTAKQSSRRGSVMPSTRVRSRVPTGQRTQTGTARIQQTNDSKQIEAMMNEVNLFNMATPRDGPSNSISVDPSASSSPIVSTDPSRTPLRSRGGGGHIPPLDHSRPGTSIRMATPSQTQSRTKTPSATMIPNSSPSRQQQQQQQQPLYSYPSLPLDPSSSVVGVADPFPMPSTLPSGESSDSESDEIDKVRSKKQKIKKSTQDKKDRNANSSNVAHSQLSSLTRDGSSSSTPSDRKLTSTSSLPSLTRSASQAQIPLPSPPSPSPSSSSTSTSTPSTLPQLGRSSSKPQLSTTTKRKSDGNKLAAI